MGEGNNKRSVKTTTKKKKKKKSRKDKWGQPVLAPLEDDDDDDQQAQHDQPEQQLWRRDDNETADVPPGGGGGESYEPNKVVVSGMPYSTTEQQIRDLFEGVGPVAQLQLSRFPDTGNFRGLAFVTFQTEECATNSLELDGTKMGNRFIKVERCRLDSQRKRKYECLGEPEKIDGCFSAYIGNLSWDVTEDELRDFFEASKISSVRFAFDKKTGKFRGFCHVDFEDDESLEKALRKNQFELHGRPMKIAYAVSSRN